MVFRNKHTESRDKTIPVRLILFKLAGHKIICDFSNPPNNQIYHSSILWNLSCSDGACQKGEIPSGAQMDAIHICRGKQTFCRSRSNSFQEHGLNFPVTFHGWSEERVQIQITEETCHAWLCKNLAATTSSTQLKPFRTLKRAGNYHQIRKRIITIPIVIDSWRAVVMRTSLVAFLYLALTAFSRHFGFMLAFQFGSVDK